MNYILRIIGTLLAVTAPRLVGDECSAYVASLIAFAGVICVAVGWSMQQEKA